MHLFHQNSNNHTYIYPYFALNYVHSYITKESYPFSMIYFYTYFIPVYLMFFLNILCMFMQTVTCNSIETNVDKKLFNKLIVAASSIQNYAIKDKLLFCFVLFNKPFSLIKKDSLYL